MKKNIALVVLILIFITVAIIVSLTQEPNSPIQSNNDPIDEPMTATSTPLAIAPTEPKPTEIPVTKPNQAQIPIVVTKDEKEKIISKTENVPMDKVDISTQLVNTGGCSNFTVYKTSLDNSLGVEVIVNTKLLGGSTREMTFSLDTTDPVVVSVVLKKGVNLSQLYCNDVEEPEQSPHEQYQGRVGKVTIDSIEEQASQDSTYLVNVTLHDINFFAEDGSEVLEYIRELSFNNVKVGWLPG